MRQILYHTCIPGFISLHNCSIEVLLLVDQVDSLPLHTLFIEIGLYIRL